MKRTITPVRKVGGTIRIPGDKSIGHRAALFSIFAKGPIIVKNFPNGADCLTSLEAAKRLGVKVRTEVDSLVLTPPVTVSIEPDSIIDCGNSATTARLLAGIIAGSNLETTLTGDESLRSRPMKRIIDPLTAMGAEFFTEDGHLPMKIRGKKLLPYEYDLPVASAQVKTAVLLAGLASSCAVTVREKTITRDHTEIMLREIEGGVTVRKVKPVRSPDPVDPRKTRLAMPEAFKKEIRISPEAQITGGTIDIPGDISTGAFFLAAAAISRRTLTIENLGLNPTRTAFLDHLKIVGCKVDIRDRTVISGEPRGRVTVTGVPLKPRKISDDKTVRLIDEIPIISVMAAFADGTTVIRGAGELQFKESNRLAAISENLQRMGVKCGLLEDGLAIEGGKELSGADFQSFGDHRIAMAFSIAALFLVGPSTIDADEVVNVSCPNFYNLLDAISL
jgi:3-phosphoshikimate 1-carboxyvinyltransferase